jgi:hypothetical protein
MTTLVQANGTWNATPAFVGKGTWPVVASASDPAGNVGTARQSLTITTNASSGPCTVGAKGETGAKGQTGTKKQTGGTAKRLTMRLSAASFKTGRGKRVQVPFVLSGPATVTLTVLSGKRVVAKLIVSCRKAGRRMVSWNGEIKHKHAARGVYKIQLRAVSPAGATARAAAKLRIA